MSNILYKVGKQNIGNKAIAFNADTFKATLLTMATQAGKIFLVTGATNPGNPIVLSMSNTGSMAAGGVVVVGGVGGNLAANGTWQLGTVVANTSIQLLTLLDGNSSTGSGAWTSGGWVMDITNASTLADVSANSNGTDVALTGVTNTGGVINAAAWTWNGLTATKSWGVAIYDSTAANDLIAFIDGTYQVYVVTQANATATSIAIARLPVIILNGTVLTFSDGSSATLTAQANVGDTSLTVSSLAAIVHRQATADVQTGTTGGSSSGLPFTPAVNGAFTLTPDSGVNKLLVL
jgi:hypothetical protein